MLRHRVIPLLLLQNEGLVKTVKFKDPKYLGDPINAIKIFNDKEVDELIFTDIRATVDGAGINFDLIGRIASECFMPFCYGGGIKDIASIRKILRLGVEKVCINSYAFENPSFIKEATDIFGSSTIVVSIDVKKNIWGKYEVWTKGGRHNTKLDPLTAAKMMEENGAGELLLTSIDKDGTMSGYDTKLISMVANQVSIPLISIGGAGSFNDLSLAIEAGSSAVAAGSLFVFHGKHRAVLISYPKESELKEIID